MLRRFFARFPHPIRGILYALRHDVSYRSQVYLVGILVIGIFFWLQPLAPWEILFILLSYTLILITELQNSSLEEALNHVHPEQHDSIGRSKDMAAGAVLIAGVFLLIVILTLSYSRFM